MSEQEHHCRDIDGIKWMAAPSVLSVVWPGETWEEEGSGVMVPYSISASDLGSADPAICSQSWNSQVFLIKIIRRETVNSIYATVIIRLQSQRLTEMK